MRMRAASRTRHLTGFVTQGKPFHAAVGDKHSGALKPFANPPLLPNLWMLRNTLTPGSSCRHASPMPSDWGMNPDPPASRQPPTPPTPAPLPLPPPTSSSPPSPLRPDHAARSGALSDRVCDPAPALCETLSPPTGSACPSRSRCPSSRRAVIQLQSRPRRHIGCLRTTSKSRGGPRKAFYCLGPRLIWTGDGGGRGQAGL